MSGYACLSCGSTDTEAEFVDIGVGSQQVTPYVCHACGYVEGNCPHGTCFPECPVVAYCGDAK